MENIINPCIEKLAFFLVENRWLQPQISSQQIESIISEYINNYVNEQVTLDRDIRAENLRVKIAKMEKALDYICENAWPISDPLNVKGGTLKCLQDRIEDLRLIAYKTKKQYE